MPENKPYGTLLVVDDERVIADTLAIILNRNGYEARAVYSPADAMALVSEFRPGTLISDVLMGGMNGVEMAIQIRTLLPDIRILLFSDPALTAHLVEKARTQGHAFETISKPFNPQDLLDKLRAS